MAKSVLKEHLDMDEFVKNVYDFIGGLLVCYDDRFADTVEVHSCVVCSVLIVDEPNWHQGLQQIVEDLAFGCLKLIHLLPLTVLSAEPNSGVEP